MRSNLNLVLPWNGLHPASWSDYSGDLKTTIDVNLAQLVCRQAEETRPLQREVAVAIKAIPDLWRAVGTIASFKKEPNWSLAEFFAAWMANTPSKRARKAIEVIRGKLM